MVVDRFHGASAEMVRSAAVQALEEEDAVDVVAVQLLEAQAAALDGSPHGYMEVSRRLNLAAFLRGKIKRVLAEPKKPFLATLTVINGRDGQAVGKITFSAGSVAALRAQLASQLWTELGSLIRRTASARQPETPSSPVPQSQLQLPPTPERESRFEPAVREAGAAKVEVQPAHPPGSITHEDYEVSAPPPAPRPGARRYPLVELQASVGLIERTFDYRDEQRGALRAYLLDGAPVAKIDAAFYPLALSSRGVVAGVGLRASFEPLLTVSSRLAERRFATRAYAYRAELSWRLPVGPLAFEPGLGFAERRYSLSESVVPGVAYKSLLANLGLSLRAAWFVARVAGGGRWLLDTGEIGSSAWFPDASGFGLDGSAQLGVAVDDWLELLLSGAAELYRLDFHVSPQAHGPGTFPNGVADGASDRYLQALFSLRFRLSRRWPIE